MAMRKPTGSRPYHYGRLGYPPPDQRDLGYALRWFFGSREEMNEIFRDFEVRLVNAIYEGAGQPTPARYAERSIPPEDDLPTADRPVQPAVKGK